MTPMEEAYRYLAKKYRYENPDIVLIELNMPAYAAESAQDFAAFDAIDEITKSLATPARFLTGLNMLYIVADKNNSIAIKSRFDTPKLAGYIKAHVIRIQNYQIAHIA